MWMRLRARRTSSVKLYAAISNCMTPHRLPQREESSGEPCRIARRAPKEPLTPPWRKFAGREGFAALETIERRPHQRKRQQSRHSFSRQLHYSRARYSEMATRQTSQLGERGF